jgi:hypothetical protein
MIGPPAWSSSGFPTDVTHTGRVFSYATGLERAQVERNERILSVKEALADDPP